MAERISDEGKTGIIKLTRNLQLLKPVLTSDGIFTDTITLNNSFLVLDFQNWDELEYDSIDDLYQLNISGTFGTSGTGGISIPISIFDEGNLITPSVSSINFVGDSVTAEILDPLNPNAVTVTVIGGTSGQACCSCNDWYINNTRSLPLPSGTSGYGQSSLNTGVPQNVTTLVVNQRDYSSLNINQYAWLDSWDDTGNYGYISLKGKTSGAYLNGLVTNVTSVGDLFYIDISVLSYGVLSFINEELCICFTQTGANGTSGTSGVDGTSGSSGISFFGTTSGTSGISGTTGSSGSSGISFFGTTSGTSGDSGTSGTNGAAGTSGTNGAAGTSGTNGATGTSGTNGAAGTSGTNGAAGTSGTNGAAGTSGTNGAAGTSGTNGAAGTSGSSGISFFGTTSGTSGDAGTSGTSGVSFFGTTSGTSGDTGTSGTNGADGTSGTSGVDGTSGTNGLDGTSGTSGVSFFGTTSGTSGDTGTSGTSGVDGTSGTNGLDGTSGTSGVDGTSGTSGCCCDEPEFIPWEDGQLVDYAKTSGVDKPVIYFYDEFSAYDSPGVMTDSDIILTLDPNLANTVDCPGKRNWKLIFPEYQRVEDGITWTVKQDGTGVNTANLVQYQSGIVTPHILEFFWDENYYLCNPVDISFAIDNSGSISSNPADPEWQLMFDGIIQIIDDLQASLDAGLCRIALSTWASSCGGAVVLSHLEGDYTTIRNTALYYKANRPPQGATNWQIGLDKGYDLLTETGYYSAGTDKILVHLTDGTNNSNCIGAPTFLDLATDIKAGTWGGTYGVFEATRIVGIGISSTPSIMAALSTIVSGTDPWTGNLFSVATFGDFTTVAGEIAASLSCPPGGYRIVKYELENFMGDRYTSPTAIGHNFTSKIKNAVWYFDGVAEGGEGSATIIPAGSTIFIKDAFVVAEEALASSPGSEIGIGLTLVDNTGAINSDLTTNVALSTLGVTDNTSFSIIRNSQLPSFYSTNGPTWGSDNNIAFARNSVPVMLSVRADDTVTGGFWVIVPYMTLKPDYNADVLDTTYELWVTPIENGSGTSGGGGTSGTSGINGSTWQYGTGSPITPGVNQGDTYVDNSTGEVYVWNGATWDDQGFSIFGTSGTSGTSGVSAFPPDVEILRWEEDQTVDYARTSGIDKPVIYFYDAVDQYDSPGNITLSLDPNLSGTVDTPGLRNWKIIFPEYQRVEDGTIWTIKQTGTGVTDAELVQYQSGIITPHILEMFWDDNYSSCGDPVDLIFNIDNSDSIEDNQVYGVSLATSTVTTIPDGYYRSSTGASPSGGGASGADIFITVSGGVVTIVAPDPSNRGRNYSYSQQLTTQGVPGGWYNMNTSSYYLFDTMTQYVVCNITQLYGEWELMMEGLLQIIDYTQGSIESGRLRIGLSYFAACESQQGIFLNLSSDYTTIRNMVVYLSDPNNRPTAGGTTWGPGMAQAYAMLADPLYYDPARQKKIITLTDGIGGDTYDPNICSFDPGPTTGYTPYQVSQFMQSGTWGGDPHFPPTLPLFPVTMMGIAINSSDVPGLATELEAITSPGNNFFDVSTFEDFTSIAGSIAMSLICLEGKYRIVKYELENFLTDLDTAPTAIGHNFTSKIKNAVWYFDGSAEGSATIIPAGSAIFIKDAFIVPQGNLTGPTTFNVGLSTVDNTGASVGVLTTDQPLTNYGISNDDSNSLIRQSYAFTYYTENGPVYKTDNRVEVVRSSVPVMISAKNSHVMTGGGFWVVVPYMTLKPDYGDDSIDTSYDLWITGSSAGSTGITLPTPNLKLSRSTPYIKVWDYNTNSTSGVASLASAPTVVASDLTEEMLASYRIFVEMLVYRRGRKPGPAAMPIGTGTQSSGYIAPSPWFVEMTPPNNAPYFPWNGTSGFWTRSGDHNWTEPGGSTSGTVSVDRPNHYEVTSVNQNIPVWEYFNGRFTVADVDYRGTSGGISQIENLVVPVIRRRQNAAMGGGRFPYSSMYTPLYAAFRYIAWDPNANAGRGQIISGPLSRVIKISHKTFPFNYDWAASGLHDAACANAVWSGTSGGPIEGLNSELKCWFETRLP